ncbi:hypothetical protein FT663_02929 [Candidozyma haemuli var. vulneris]|uniref:FMN hydroxy acid dehydrogenase domain-containing protein n=1 Tax=Candidozyma haemuli TaxID=45357 RepID=A0A2V1AZN1_9ASCO|nr:hypothetical protein CXQ85_005369 [[Candida] haemuloni]KAF3987330.1 hypothetical protein FT662_04061 [[Candida] haemuloni var. vulneris]KAF3990963.1 hypothetical protein FT663_02929 [[Candida] haemuloni var. vulneris]PVH22341.1 hypothetical protein CXQ85_005369 [[Candida] haemuloni]
MNRAKTYDENVHTIAELEELATAQLSPMTRGYYNGGAMELVTLKENKTAFDKYKFRPRVLVDVTHVDTSTTCLGAKSAFPLGIAPSACHGLAHPIAEIGTSRAAAKSGVHMILSCWSNTPSKDVIEEGKGSSIAYGQQVNVLSDEETNLNIIREPEETGYNALFLTVDTRWRGRRINEMKNKFELPEHLSFPSFPWMGEKNTAGSEEFPYGD